MSQDAAAALWERVLERDPELKQALSGIRVEEAKPVNPFDVIDTKINVSLDEDEAKRTELADIDPNPFDVIDLTFDEDEAKRTELPDFNTDIDTNSEDDGAEPSQAENAVDVSFEERADLWLSRSRLALEHALLSMRLTRDVFPTSRPLLIFSSPRSKLATPEYHRVEVTPNGWPRGLQSTEPLTSTAAAKILASSHSISPSFEGETVAVEVLNPLLVRNRWIVLWPELKDLPDPAEFQQWRQVRRVVWCVDRDQVGPRDVINWLSSSWPDIPIRIALFRAASFVQEERDTEAKSKKLSGVRRALEKFDRIKSRPWIVVEPQ